MLVTLLGIVMEIRPEQWEKTFSPIDVTLLGIVTEVRPLQREKAPSPIDVTLLGIVTEVRPLQPAKAPTPMLVTLLGIVVFLHPVINVLDDVSIIALQLLRESNLVFPSSTTMLVSSKHL